MKNIIIFMLMFLPSFTLAQDDYEKDNSFVFAHIIDKNQIHNFHTAGDQDWVMFYGISGINYTVKFSNVGSRCNIISELYDFDGTTKIDNVSMTWKCTRDGLFYLKITNAYDVFGVNTDYELSLESSEGYDVYENDNTHEQSRIISLDYPQHHNFHNSKDEDWVKFYGVSGVSYTIETVNLEKDCDTLIQLYDTDTITILKESKSGFEGEDESLNFQCKKDGIYYIRIKSQLLELSGKNTGYDLRIFISLGDLPVNIAGVVTDCYSGKGVSGAIIKTCKGRTEISQSSGAYAIREHEKINSCSFDCSALCYTPLLEKIDIDKDIEKNISMIPIGFESNCLDINGDSSVTIDDVIIVLKVMAGMDISGLIRSDRNGKIGMEKAIAILQKIIGLRN